MLYLAHMSCEEPLVNDPEQSNYSTFTCIVEADNVEQAQKKLRNLIFKLRKDHDMFGRVSEIYLDDLIEIKKVPLDGFLARYESRTLREEFDTLSTSLPGVDEEHCAQYTLLPSQAQEADEPAMLTPFIHL